MSKEYITTTEAVEICREKGHPLKGGRASIWFWVQEGKLGRKKRIGGRLLIDKARLLEFLSDEG